MTDTEITTRIARTLRRFRKRAKMSQTALGRALGVHQAAVCRIELGSQQLSVPQLFEAARMFGLRLRVERAKVVKARKKRRSR